ncbi:MAG: hypothetical protein FWG25_06220, partial [Promicromonosporaceae bacterium]|nr:hypothetical protein [Promicromonosporaceae bacterium]
MAQAILKDWAPTNGFTDPDNLWVEVTARAGHKDGQWEHPDITLVGIQNLLGVKRKKLVTFEVKPRDEIAKATWIATDEAARQKGFTGASRSYVLFHVPHYLQKDADIIKGLTAAQAAARTANLGVIAMENPHQFRSNDELETPKVIHQIETLKAYKYIREAMPSGAAILQAFDGDTPAAAPATPAGVDPSPPAAMPAAA